MLTWWLPPKSGCSGIVCPFGPAGDPRGHSCSSFMVVKAPGTRLGQDFHLPCLACLIEPGSYPCYSRHVLGSPAPALFRKTLCSCAPPHLGGTRGPVALALASAVPRLGAGRKDLVGSRHGTVTVVRPPRGCEVKRKWLGFPHLLPGSSAGKSKAWAWPRTCCVWPGILKPVHMGTGTRMGLSWGSKQLGLRCVPEG